MNDQTSAEMFKQGIDWLSNHRRLYLSSGGRQGHLIDLTFSGGKGFSTHLLLRYVGRKSGKVYINPVFYGIIGNEVTIVASKGGADHHPAWYLNLVSRDKVEFQIATQAFRGTWREPQGAEREAVWKAMVANNGSFARYQSTTQRQIPLVMMKMREEIPVFSEADVS